MQQIKISEIKIGKRFRKEIGDITSLADSIEEVDLLHPIVLDDDNNLVAGFRRIRAFERLGRDTIPFTKISIDNPTYGELHENNVRKNFTTEETADIVDYIESTRIGHRPKKGDDSSPLPRGKTINVVAKMTDKSPQTIQKIKTISDAARKEPEKYSKFLHDIDTGKKSINTAHKLVTQIERNLPKVPLPKKIADVFYCDVPISFRDKGVRGAAEHHYPTMTVHELMNEKLASAKNAVIFFWMSPSIAYDEIPIPYKYAKDSQLTTQVEIPIYKAILDAWGFKVKSEFVWKKDKIGNGSWCRYQHENLFFAIKGKMPTPAKLFSSVIDAIRVSHSEKPKLHKMIMEMYPKRNYQELYSREKIPGWTTHGNQLKSEIITCRICKNYDVAKNKKPTLKQYATKKDQTQHLIKEHGKSLVNNGIDYFTKVEVPA